MVPYGDSIFNIGRSGFNIISKAQQYHCPRNKCTKSFISERVMKFWNKLPLYCKSSESVNSFKSNLQLFKKSNIHLSSVDHFWDVSDIIFSKLEGDCYSKNRQAHIDYLLDNRKVAIRKGININ